MKFCKFMFWYSLVLTVIILLNAAFLNQSDFQVRLDGWMAVANAICTVFWRFAIEKERRHA